MTFPFRPNALIDISGQSLSAAEAGLQGLTVTLGLGRHGQGELVLWPGSKFADAAEGDPISIALGPMGDEGLVMQGTITARRQQAGCVVLEALDMTGKLSRTRRAITFEESSISDIVTRIADEAGVGAVVDGSDTLSIYYVTPQRPLWDHLRDLARLTGHDLGADDAGQLLFQPADNGSSHTLRHGAELMGWQVRSDETPSPIKYGAHGTASSSGTWHWVATDPLGDDPGAARIVGAFSDQSLADLATDAHATATDRARLGGHLVITGNAAIRPADSAVVEGLPGGDPDPLRVRGVRHQMNGDTGFVTCLEVEGGGTGGGLLGGIL